MSNENKNMTYIHYIDRGALLDPTNGVRMRMWLRFQLEMICKCSKHDALAASIVNDEVAYLVLDRTPWIKDLMLLCGVRELLIAEQFLTNTSYIITLFFKKVRVTCFLDHDSSFISIIRDVDLLPLREIIGPMSRLYAPITLAIVKLGVWILLSLCSCDGCCCWCWCRSVGQLIDWRWINRCETRLNSDVICWLLCMTER